VTRRDFPRIHFYNQDFVDVYDKTWAWVQDGWMGGGSKSGLAGKFYTWPDSSVLSQADAVYSSFFLVYSNRIYQAYSGLDILYSKQEASGAIRWAYNLEDGEPVFTADNPEGVGMPLLAWAEFNLYHKGGNKKRIKDIIPMLDQYTAWIDDTFKRANGLYETPLAATGMWNAPRGKAAYLVDFNCAMAMNALHIAALSDILNDKETSFRYKQRYFSLKTRINTYFWDDESGFYYDADRHGKRLNVKTIAGFWPLLAEIPNDDKAERLISKLQDPRFFGTPHPFPSVAANEPTFSEDGLAYRGAVFPHLTFVVIKGLERYQRWDLARDYAIRHVYFILDSMNPEGEQSHGAKNYLWEAYLPKHEGPSLWPDDTGPRKQYLSYAALSTITMMMENVVGLNISLPRKTVNWTVPNLEVMGIENLALKKNLITILSNKSGRGWEIHMESEKLYYFTINVIGKKKKTLPIPSGKCSMLIDKL
jgi:neutral trehalase